MGRGERGADDEHKRAAGPFSPSCRRRAFSATRGEVRGGGIQIAMANEFARHLRRNRTEAERRLWWRLRELKHAGFKFRQQVPIDRFIVDFACLS
jgi:hypothetical protein